MSILLRASQGISVAFWPHWWGTLISCDAQCGSEALAFLYPGEYLFICWDSADSISTHVSSGLAPSLANPLGKPIMAISSAAATQIPHIPSWCLWLLFLGSTSSNAVPPTLCGINVMLLWLYSHCLG